MHFEFSDRLHPGEGRSYDVTSDEDSSSYNVTAVLLTYPAGATIGALPVSAIDSTRWRVIVPDSMTVGIAQTRAILKVTVTDPIYPTEPDILEALVVILPV